MRSGRTGLRHRFSGLFAGAFLIISLLSADAYGEEADITGRELTIDECVSLGLKVNPSIDISAQNLKAAEEKIGEARGGYYPSFRASSSYAYATTSENKAWVSTDSYDLKFSGTQLLYDGGARSNLVESATHGARARKHDLKKTGLDIILNVKTTFYEVLKRQDLLDVAKAVVFSAEKHLGQAKELYKEGLSPRSDVIKAEVQLASSKLEVIKAENALLLAKANLAGAMGVPVTTAFNITPPAKEGDKEFPALNDMVKHAYRNRPELKSIKASVDSAGSDVRRAESGFYPDISLDASYGWKDDAFVPDEEAWSAGVTIGIPIFERLTTKSRVAQTTASLNGLKATERQIMRNIELEIEQAWLSLKEALERFEVTQKILEQAAEDLRVSEGRYKEGLGDILELLDGQTAYTTASTDTVIARYEIEAARARLDRAAGYGAEAE